MYNHWEVRYARDERYKLYGNGDLYDTAQDVLEKNPSRFSNETKATHEVRDKLQQVLDSYPSVGRNVDYSRVQGSLPEVVN